VGPFLTNRGQNEGRASGINILSSEIFGWNDGRASGINTLSRRVFNRSRFHAQRNYDYTHKGAKLGLIKGVIPTQLTRAHFGDNLLH
jgi:hypothetical protein